MDFRGVLWAEPPFAWFKMTANESIDVINISFGGGCILVLVSYLHLLLDRRLGDVLFSMKIHVWALNVHNPSQTSTLS